MESIEVLKHGKVRRAKLNYLKKLSGKAARLQEVKKDTANAAEAVAAEAAAAAEPAAAPVAETTEAK